MLSVVFAVFALALAGSTSAAEVCPDGTIGLGHSNNGQQYSILSNNCGSISTANAEANLGYCSTYTTGGYVYCNGATPVGAQTPDGTQWNNCTVSAASAGCNGWTVGYCCTRISAPSSAAPPASSGAPASH